MTKYIFLDTNVFLHCKTFTEIDWRNLFEEIQNNEEIIIVVPYMVNKELDNLKRYEKKARNIQNKLKELKDVEFKEGITLNISFFPAKWSSLKPEWIEILDENESDCKIIAEILIFKENNPDDEVYFITGDNTPYFQGDALGINTIFWLDKKYKTIFKPSETQPTRKNKLTDLKLFFKITDNKDELSTENELSLDEFIAEEFPEFPNLMKEEEEEEIVALEENEKSEISKNMTIKDAKEKGLAVANSFGSNLSEFFSPLLFYLKSSEKFKEEVLKYYEEMKEYRKYIEIKLFLTNRGNRPYNTVNIEIFTLMEKGFKLKSKEELEKPEKPKIENDFFPLTSLAIPQFTHKEYNVKYISPENIEKERNDIWVFGYSVKKIQHNNTLGLYPIMIKFPEKFKMKKIQFLCTFKHDEEGVTKDQKFTINISK